MIGQLLFWGLLLLAFIFIGWKWVLAIVIIFLITIIIGIIKKWNF